MNSNSDPFVSAIKSRYRDAYRSARIMNIIGIIAKFLGVIAMLLSLAWLLPIGASALSGNVDTFLMTLSMGVFIAPTAFLVGLILFVLGTLLSGQAQLILVSVDSVIQNSPFLSHEERLEIINL